MNLEKYFKIERSYSINNGLIDVEGDVILIKQVDKLPFKFGKVSGNFNCSYNQLTNLEGSPNYVGGSFDCSRNKLTNLEGCPSSVGGNFNCSDNQLTNLEGSPKEIKGDFNCDEKLHDTNEYVRYLIIKKLTM